jgi:hypothetical protein
MNTWRISLTLLLAAGSASTAQAQIGQFVRPQVNPRPTVSPYLSVFRGQHNAAVNYYNIVRPQIDMGRQLQVLQSNVHGLQGAPPPGAPPILPPLLPPLPLDQPGANMPTTGHPVAFMYSSHFYTGRIGSTGVGVAGGQGNPVGYPSPAAPLRAAILADRLTD